MAIRYQRSADINGISAMSISAEEAPQPTSRNAATLRDALEPGEDRLLAGVDWRDDEADAARKPAGLAAGAKSEAMRGTARAPSSAPASPPAAAPSPSNHLHPQATSPS